MITTNNDDCADKLRLLSLHGLSNDAWKRYSSEGSWFYEIKYPGYKYNMSDIQAAIGLRQLEKFDSYQENRKNIVSMYNEGFRDLSELERPFVKDDVTHAWHLYVIRLKLESLKINRNEFIEELARQNIGTSVHFIPLHLHPCYQNKYGSFPNAEYVYERVLSLPLYPNLKIEHVKRIIQTVKDTIYRYKKSHQYSF